MVEPLHHAHRRKRIHQKHEPYPHPHKWKRFLDRIIYVVGVAGPIVTIPQITKIWIEKNATGVSLTAWTGYTIFAVIWLLYGIAHKEKPIIITYSAVIIANTFVTIGTFIYG